MEKEKTMLKKEDFAPLSFWAWNTEMSDEEIEKQIISFKEQGLKGFFMHSRAGLLTPYMEEEWFRACKTAVMIAEREDMEAWIYDEDGWPSGFAGGRVNSLGEEFQSKELILTGDKTIVDEGRLLATYQVDGMEKWLFYRVEENYVDLLSMKVVDAFIASTHEVYKQHLGEYFGGALQGVFTDEPQFHRFAIPYSFELEETFREHHGYSFLDHAYLLDQTDEEGRRFTKHYWETIGEMFLNNFTKNIFTWCEENNLKFTGHMPAEDSIIQQMQETAGVMPNYEYMHLPGMDHLGRRITPITLSKQIGSASKQFNKKRILSETFGCTGWNVSFEQLSHIWGWQALSGVNVPCLHIGTQSISGVRKRDYPAFFSYQEPWWEEFHYFSEWMTELNWQISKGKFTENILVLNPIRTLYNTFKAYPNYFEQLVSAEYRQLQENLLDCQLGYDIGDELIMAKYAEIKGQELWIKECGYKFIVVPPYMLLEETTVTLLKAFEAGGGTIIFVGVAPKEWEERTKYPNLVILQNRRDFIRKYFDTIHYERELTILEESGFYIAQKFHTLCKKGEDGSDLFYIWNGQVDAKRHVVLKIKGHKVLRKVDMLSNKKEVLASYFDENYTYCPIQIAKYGSVLLESSDGEAVDSKTTLITRKQIVPTNVKLTEKNNLVIDQARYSFDDQSYSDKMYMPFLQEKMFSEIGHNHKIYISYTFTVNNIQEDMSVVIEGKNVEAIYVNREKLPEETGWFIDREFKEFCIDDKVVLGENTVKIEYSLDPKTVKNVDGLFETEVNRFFYPVEPEAIYIRGNFDVAVSENIIKKPTHIKVPNGEMTIVSPTPKTESELTQQGLWFYRGNVELECSVTKTADEKVYLDIEDVKAAAVKIIIENQEELLFMSPYTVELTDYLVEGENTVIIRLLGSNRNILGPHHHIKGEMLYTGPNTFVGKYGYEDELVNFDVQPNQSTWSDAYHFVDFGCGKIEIIKETER